MGMNEVILERLGAARGGWTPQDYSAKLSVQERIICIASDVHVPYHDEQLLAFMFAECANRGVEAIVWLGDLLDAPEFSKWPKEDKSVRWERDLKIARVLIESAFDFIPTLKREYWSEGNHEKRYFSQLDYNAGMTALAYQAGLSPLVEDTTLIMSDNPTLMYLNETWMLTHPKSYGPSPLVVPGKLADRFNVNVVSAHAHHYAMGVSPSAGYTVIETGGLFKQEYHKYIQYQVTTHRSWQQGFWIIDNGRATGYRGEYFDKESA